MSLTPRFWFAGYGITAAQTAFEFAVAVLAVGHHASQCGGRPF